MTVPMKTSAVWLNTMPGPLPALRIAGAKPAWSGWVGTKPIKESTHRRDPERWKDLDEPAAYAVSVAKSETVTKL